MAAQPPPDIATHFNPYYNNIILRNADGTNNSASIKLIEKANEGCDASDRFTGKRGTLLNFLKMLERFSREFDWERLRSIEDRNGDNFDIFEQYGQISLEDIILFQDQNIWNVRQNRNNIQDINQKKLRLTYMHQKIENCCSQQVLNELQKKKNLYTKPNGEADGIVFLKLLITKYSTSTVYTSRNIIKHLRTIKLSDFDNNVQTLYEHLEEQISLLTSLGFTHDHLLMDIFDILKTSTNADFVKDIKDEEKKYERGQAMDWTDLMDHAVDTYTDLIDKNLWNVKDPRDERIMSLATIIEKMVTFASVKNNSGRGISKKTFKPIDDWKFLRNGDESTKTVNGTEYHWYNHHYEHGMWVTHTPGSCGRATSHVRSKYDKAAHEAQWKKKNNVTSISNNNSSQNSSNINNTQFQLDGNLQKALCTISNSGDFNAAAFLAAYGIDSEEEQKK